MKTGKPINKQSKRSLPSMKRKVWGVFSQYIRMRDCLRTTGCSSWGLCITCGKRLHFKMLQAGHFISGRNNAVLFQERGVHAQCYNCNINLRGNTLKYRRMINLLYGEGADVKLETEADQTIKFTIEELQEKYDYYKEKIKELE